MDSVRQKQKRNENVSAQDGFVRFSVAKDRIVQHHATKTAVERFARNGFRSHTIYTEDSGRYITPKQQVHIRQNSGKIIQARELFDTINYRYQEQVHLEGRHVARISPLRVALSSWRGWFRFDISPVRAWNLSLVGAMVFGMISMTMIYRSFGQPAFATEPSAAPVHEGQRQEQSVAPLTAASREISAYSAQRKIDNAQREKDHDSERYVEKDPQQIAFEKRAQEMVEGYPIEKMLPEIFKQDRVVAAFMIAMAKQESQWGKRVPVLNGEDCLNYWGFRSKRERMGSGGHTCFDSIEDAVTTVGRRINELVYEYDRKTAARLIVWKCGYSCAGHNQSNVASWKRTVQMYYDALMKE